MGYLDDISTIAKTMASARNAVDSVQSKSITKGALDGVMQFPCLVPDSQPIDRVSILGRYLERTYASFVQAYLSTNNVMDISVDKNPSMYLKKFHKNVKLESTVQDLYNEYCLESDEEYDALMERIYDGSTAAYINENENKMIVFNFSDTFSKTLMESHRESLEQALADIDFTPFPNISNSPFYEAIGNADGSLMMYGTTKAIDHASDIAKADYQDQLDRQRSTDMEIWKNMRNGNIGVPTILKDNDVKKQNDMQPYLMQVRLMAVNNNQEFVQFMDFVVGVKVVVHSLKSDEMIANIQNALQNNGKLFNFIRWTTGEKSLFKDLLFNINDIKLDVANRSKGASPWWMTLKRLKETSRAQKAFFTKHQMVPNSTIIVGSYEVDTIQKNIGLNLRDPKIANKLKDSLFLMNFIIVDDGRGIIDVLYDGETSYQTYALETLERETSMNSNKLGRELTRMISR